MILLIFTTTLTRLSETFSAKKSKLCFCAFLDFEEFKDEIILDVHSSRFEKDWPIKNINFAK